MNILLINTSDRRGGAAIAAYRLMNALRANGHDTRMLVRDRLSDNGNVIQIGNRYAHRWNFLTERAQIFVRNRFSRKHLFDISTASSGTDVMHHPLFVKADLIHLHWVNQGMLSLKEIGTIITSGKKVVWTLHDMWAFTGICHHAGDCKRYEKGCGACPYMRSRKSNDLSAQLFALKQQLYARGKIHFVAVSNWLAEQALKSPLLVGHSIHVIPNIINTKLFTPATASDRRNSSVKTLVMGAARLDHPIKGLQYLKEALRILVKEQRIHPQDVKLVLFGDAKNRKSMLSDIPIESDYLGPIYDVQKVAAIYRQADAVAVPSLYETFGQTLTEGMACGCGGISFNNSGQQDIIDHKKNGYLARYKETDDLAEGIYWTLFEADRKLLSQNAREKVVTHYAEEVVAEQYIQLYHRK